MQDPNSLKHIYQCVKCNTLYLWTEQEFNELHPQCDICQKEKFELKKNKLLLQCQECFEYFPRRIIRMLHPPGLLHCLKKECYGVLGIRFQLTEMTGQKKNMEDFELIEEEFIGIKEPSIPEPIIAMSPKETPKLTGDSGLHFPEPTPKRLPLKSEPVGLPPVNLISQPGIEDPLKPIFKIDKIPMKMSVPKIKRMDFTELPMVGELELLDNIQDLDTVLPSEGKQEKDEKISNSEPNNPNALLPKENIKNLNALEQNLIKYENDTPSIEERQEEIPIKQDLPVKAETTSQVNPNSETESLSPIERVLQNETIEESLPIAQPDIHKQAEQSEHPIEEEMVVNEELTPHPIEENIQPFRFLSIDPANLYVNYQMPFMRELFDKILSQEPPFHLTYQDCMEICTQMVVTLHARNEKFREEPVEYTYYIGETGGDIHQLQILCRYFQKIFPTYPQTKVVFLGNYIGHTQNDFEAFLLLLLATILYPENIILLRGKSEIFENAEKLGFWTRIKEKFTEAQIDPDAIAILQKYCLDIMAHLPLFHIAKMNEGTINVLSTTSGIPFDSENPANIVNIQQLSDTIIWGSETENQLDIYSKTILMATPDENLPSQLSVAHSSMDFAFGVNLFRQYLQRNSFHYMVRSEAESEEAIQFYYDAFCCSVFSAQKYWLPEEKQFKGKLVRLVPGNPPYILEITEEELEIDLNGVFNLQ